MSKCIICGRPLSHISKTAREYHYHIGNYPYINKGWSRIAHTQCSILMRLAKTNTKLFGMKCLKYEINQTDKALYIQLANVK